MRMMLNVRIPHEKFNAAVRAGTAGPTLERILAATHPEAVYFTEQNGVRAVTLIVDVAEPSRIPSLAEPWFLSFDADCELRIVMSPDELGNAGLREIGETWA